MAFARISTQSAPLPSRCGTAPLEFRIPDAASKGVAETVEPSLEADAQGAALKAIRAALQLFDLCPPQDGGTIRRTDLEDVLRVHLGQGEAACGVQRHFNTWDQDTSSGLLDFLSYWHGMDLFFAEAGAWPVTSRLGHKTSILSGMRTFRDGVLGLWRRFSPHGQIPGDELLELLAEVQACTEDPEFWNLVMRAVPHRGANGLSLGELGVAVCDWLRRHSGAHMARGSGGRPMGWAFPLALLSTGAFAAPWTTQPNPPPWPPSVRVFGPEDLPEAIEAAVTAAFRMNGGREPTNHGEFSSARFAFLFKPGTYKVNVPVGYYTQVLGLGRSPDEVLFDSSRGVYCEESNNRTIFGSLATFWRGAENFRTRRDMLWATSQATPVRRAIIDGDLRLSEYSLGLGEGYSSGGFVGNVRVGGKMKAGSQQQYFARNAELASGSDGGVWNMVFVGTMGAPPSTCGRHGSAAATVTVRETPRIAEKPFISIGDDGKYQLHIPRTSRHRVGPDFSWGRIVPFERVFVASADDTARAINKKLREGLHVVLSPGIYRLEATLHVGRDNQVLLGIGFPTLIAPAGGPALRVGNADGVRVSGILLEAGAGDRPSLLEWGHPGYEGDPENPSFLHDVFARVGGPTDQAKVHVASKTMITLNAGNVVGDNLWLWRADHGVGGLVKHGDNPCDTGLMVHGSHVTMYGLAVEHTLKDLVQWSGEAGETYFYQSEYPYDVTQAFGDAGYVSYRVNDTVDSHHAYGVGVYHFFRDHPVHVANGILVPPWVANSFTSPLGVFLNGKGRVDHIINNKGAATTLSGGKTAQAEWFCGTFPYVLPPTSITSTTTTTTLTTTTATATSVTYTGTQTKTTTTFTTTLSSTTTTQTATTITSTQTMTATTTTTTETSTVSSTTTTTTTTLLWWQAMATEIPQGPVAWIGALLLLNACLVCTVLACGCCRRRRVTEAQVPVSRLLSILGSPRRNGAFSPMPSLFDSQMGTPRDKPLAASPGRHGDTARRVSVDRGLGSALRLSSSGFLDGPAGSPARRGGDSPMRQNMARMFSVMSMAESVFSLSPHAAPSPWVRHAREEGEA